MEYIYKRLEYYICVCIRCYRILHVAFFPLYLMPECVFTRKKNWNIFPNILGFHSWYRVDLLDFSKFRSGLPFENSEFTFWISFIPVV